MANIDKIPEWFGAAMIGAIIAALGYVAKLFLDWFRDTRERSLNRRAKLVELFSLLSAGDAAYAVQREKRNQLGKMLSKKLTSSENERIGYERQFSIAYSKMTEDERELHTIIRSYTMNTFAPLNKQLLEWLRSDTYFKGMPWRKGAYSVVAKRLTELEAHLLLWEAKYTVWIPDYPEHSLVYLADEEEHGIGFPKNIKEDVANLLQTKWFNR